MKRVLALGSVIFLSSFAHAWNGPVCITSAPRQLTLSLREVAGSQINKADELTVRIEDNEGELSTPVIQPSTTAQGFYDLVFTRGAVDGIVGIEIGKVGRPDVLRYEFEFRAHPLLCAGASLKLQ